MPNGYDFFWQVTMVQMVGMSRLAVVYCDGAAGCSEQNNKVSLEAR